MFTWEEIIDDFKQGGDVVGHKHMHVFGMYGYYIPNDTTDYLDGDQSISQEIRDFPIFYNKTGTGALWIKMV